MKLPPPRYTLLIVLANLPAAFIFACLNRDESLNGWLLPVCLWLLFSPCAGAWFDLKKGHEHV